VIECYKQQQQHNKKQTKAEVLAHFFLPLLSWISKLFPAFSPSCAHASTSSPSENWATRPASTTRQNVARNVDERSSEAVGEPESSKDFAGC